MIFTESKKENEDGEIVYTVQDIFGIITIYSKEERLDVKTLDTLVDHIIKLSQPKGDIEINYGDKQHTLRFTYEAVEQWGESDDTGENVLGA